MDIASQYFLWKRAKGMQETWYAGFNKVGNAARHDVMCAIGCRPISFKRRRGFQFVANPRVHLQQIATLNYEE